MRTRRRDVILGMAASARVHAAAAQTQVDLLLVLAVDASGSVSQDRFELQREGYSEAFRTLAVQNAVRGGPVGAIAVMMVQWTGPALQVRVVDWRRVGDAASAEGLADAIAGAPRRLFRGGTSISGVIDYSMAALASAPFAAPRRVIDISGDGANNIGRSVDAARDNAVANGVSINGLPILAVEPDLDSHYRDHVIGGSGAFLIAIDNYSQFAAAIRRKLVTEISSRIPLPHGPKTMMS